MHIVEHVLAPERGRNRHGIGLSKRLDIGTCLLGPTGTADDHQRTFGHGQLGAEIRHGLRPNFRTNRDERSRVRHIDHITLHVFRNGNGNGAGATRGGHMEGLADQFGYPVGVIDLDDLLTDRAIEFVIIHFLEGFAIFLITRDLTDENDHRRRILHRRMNTDRAIACAGAPRHHRDARLSGELAVGFRHIGGTAFLAASDCLNLVLCVVQCIDNRKITLSRNAENRVDTVDAKLVDQYLPAAPEPIAPSHANYPSCAFIFCSRYTERMGKRQCHRKPRSSELIQGVIVARTLS